MEAWLWLKVIPSAAFAAAEALHQTIGAVIPAYERTRFDREVARVRALLQEETFTMALNEGKNMTVEQAAGYALRELQEQREHLANADSRLTRQNPEIMIS
ncbi:MAG: hypothetical protein ACREOO_09680 [bacterium]